MIFHFFGTDGVTLFSIPNYLWKSSTFRMPYVTVFLLRSNVFTGKIARKIILNSSAAKCILPSISKGKWYDASLFYRLRFVHLPSCKINKIFMVFVTRMEVTILISNRFRHLSQKAYSIRHTKSCLLSAPFLFSVL